MDQDTILSAALDLLEKYDLHLDWYVDFDNAKGRYGACDYQNDRLIFSSMMETLNEEDAMDVIRHEVAHALADPRANHGPAWRAWAVEVGATPRAKSGPQLDLADPKVASSYRWQGVCPVCQEVVGVRHRLTQAARSYYHTPCAVEGQEEETPSLEWRRVA